MAHAQKPDFVFQRNGQINLNRRRRQFSRLLAAEVCASAVVMLDTPCSVVVWRVLSTHSIHQFPLHFPSRATQCAITFELDSNICKSLEQRSQTFRPPYCIILPTATFAFCVYRIKIKIKFRHSSIPLAVVSRHTSCKPSHNNRFGSLPWKVWRSVAQVFHVL